MIKPFTARVLLDAAGFCLFVICYAYYWQGNMFHEWIGALFIAFAFTHNLLNRAWYRSKAKRLPRKSFGYTRLLAQLGMVGVALILFISSILLSRDINPYGPINYDYWIRQIHHLAAYWLLVLVGIHVGRNWSKMIGFLHSKQPKWLQAIRFKPIKIGLISGIVSLAMYGFIQLGMSDKLLMSPSVDMWNFTTKAPEFLIFIGAMVFGVITLTYQLTKRIR